jgi:ferric enterobactin receptor
MAMPLPKILLTQIPMKNILILLFCLSAVVWNTVSAQIQKTYKIHGVVADSLSQKPLDKITVTLSADQMPSQNMVTGSDGKFQFSSLKTSVYRLDIHAVGYKHQNLTIQTKADTDIGIVKLKADVKSLNEVQVTAQRPLIQQKPGKVIYDIQADPESKAKSLMDMLHKIPFITVDADDNVMLKGNSNFKVFINGKPSGMMENNLKAVLRTMPASTVLRIEVITTPPAKYDAEGVGGIINIITIKSTTDGYRGTLSANERFPQGGPNVGTSFTIKQGKLGIDGYGGAGIYNNPQTNTATMQQSYGAAPTLLTQAGYKSNNSKNGYFGTELSYEIDSLHLLSGGFSINGYSNNNASYQTSSLMGSGGLLQGYTIDNNNNGHGGGGDASLNYQIGFKANKNRLLTFSYRYSGYGNHAFSNVGLSKETNYPVADYQQPNDESTSEHTFQADFSTPVKKVTIEAGAKAILRSDRSNSQYLQRDSISGQYAAVPSLGDQFYYTQDVFGLYNSYQFHIGKWNIYAGVRAEETYIDAHFISTNTGIKPNYLNVVPSVSINRQLGKGGLSLAFNERIQRPGIYRLNPFVNRSNPNFITVGNPNLRPNTMNDVQIGYNTNAGKVSIFAAVDYIFVNDLSLQVTSFDPATQVTTATYQNTGAGHGVTFVTNITYNSFHGYSINFNSNTTKFDLHGINGTSTVYLNRWMTILSLSNTLRLNKGWGFNAGVNYNGISPTSLQGTTNAFFSTTAGVNKELVKNKLYFAVAVNNPFTQFRNSIITTNGPDFMETNINQVYFRSVNVSLNYNFGRLNGDVKKAKKNIRNDDVSNGGL